MPISKYQIPSLQKRLFAFSIDFYLQLSVFLGFFIFSAIMDWIKTDSLSGSVRFSSPFIIGSFVVIFFSTLIFNVYFVVQFGATPGKLAVGLKIQNFSDGKRLSTFSATKRWIFLLLSYFSGWFLFSSAWYSPLRRHWGDQLAGSVVVDKISQNKNGVPLKIRPVLATGILLLVALPMSAHKVDVVKNKVFIDYKRMTAFYSPKGKNPQESFQTSVFSTARFIKAPVISEARIPASNVEMDIE